MLKLKLKTALAQPGQVRLALDRVRRRAALLKAKLPCHDPDASVVGEAVIVGLDPVAGPVDVPVLVRVSDRPELIADTVVVSSRRDVVESSHARRHDRTVLVAGGQEADALGAGGVEDAVRPRWS